MSMTADLEKLTQAHKTLSQAAEKLDLTITTSDGDWSNRVLPTLQHFLDTLNTAAHQDFHNGLQQRSAKIHDTIVTLQNHDQNFGEKMAKIGSSNPTIAAPSPDQLH